MQAAGRRRFVYVVERDGTFVGWMDIDAVEHGHSADEAVTRVDPAEVSVVDDAGKLVGEITLAAVEDAIADTDFAEQLD